MEMYNIFVVTFVIIHRFEALVEREWLQAGHPFADRCAKSAFAITKHRQEAPSFLVFLDCVWQVRHTTIIFYVMFPNSNSRLRIVPLVHVNWQVN